MSQGEDTEEKDAQSSGLSNATFPEHRKSAFYQHNSFTFDSNVTIQRQ